MLVAVEEGGGVAIVNRVDGTPESKVRMTSLKTDNTVIYR